MVEINIPRSEKEALKTVEDSALRQAVAQCIENNRTSALRQLRLESCGPYVATKLREFERALAAYGKAKAEKKRAETRSDALSAGSHLLHSVQRMKERMSMEDEEGQRFYVDDLIVPPVRFREQLSVRVCYRWRTLITDSWTNGEITIFYDVDLRPDYSLPVARRKLSSARQEKELQDALCRNWEHLKTLALCSVRDFFKQGGRGLEIPKIFQAKLDTHTRGLNNFSANFWR